MQSLQHGRAPAPRALVEGDDDLARPDGHRGGEGSVEDEVRSPREQQPVLGAERLALGAVDDDDRASAPFGHGAQLDGRREARAAPAAQARPLDLVDEIVLVAPVRPVQRRQVAVHGEMGVEVHHARLRQAGEQAGERVRLLGGAHTPTPSPEETPLVVGA